MQQEVKVWLEDIEKTIEVINLLNEDNNLT